MVPISGGGMIAGMAVAAKGLNPAIRIIGAEPRGEQPSHPLTRVLISFCGRFTFPLFIIFEVLGSGIYSCL